VSDGRTDRSRSEDAPPKTNLANDRRGGAALNAWFGRDHRSGTITPQRIDRDFAVACHPREVDHTVRSNGR